MHSKQLTEMLRRYHLEKEEEHAPFKDFLREIDEQFMQYEANRFLTIERDGEKEHVALLEKVNTMKSEFVSSVSHELRTPLASIIGFTETIYTDDELPNHTTKEFLKIILDEAMRLSKLINDLLDIGRIESGGTTIEKTDHDIVKTIVHSISLVAAEAERKKISISLRHKEMPFFFRYDNDSMEQILLNLLTNAVKFTPDGGNIRVSAKKQNSYAIIRVKDSGFGIPAEDIPFLFNKFFRVHRPGFQVRGTGLGLAIVKHLVELHNGTISVESTPDRGSIFIIKIPLQ